MRRAGPGIAATAATRAFWWCCALAAPPIAVVAASRGLGIAAQSPLRDIAVLCLASVAEEIVFRGALQPVLARQFAERDAPWPWPWLTLSNLATSLAFAAAHLWRHPPLAALAVFPVSIVYGIARERSGRVWPAASLHVYFNLLLYAASRLVA